MEMMMTKTRLYYVVNPDLTEIEEGLFDSNGNKTLWVYKIKDDIPLEFAVIHTEMTKNSEEAINDFLIDNEFEPDVFKLIEL